MRFIVCRHFSGMGVVIFALAAGLAAGPRQEKVHVDSIPLVFTPNIGQEVEPVRFTSSGQGYTLCFAPQETIFLLRTAHHAGELRMKVSHARPDATVSGLDNLSAKINYLIGNDPSKWRTGVQSYGKIAYRNVLPGVDLIYYGHGRRLEYDFRLSPGADPRRIDIALGGAGWKSQVTRGGDLDITSPEGSIRFGRPVAYQVDSTGVRRSVQAHYILESGNRFRFQLGRYDHSRELVIDPELVYGTFFGGTNDEYGNAIALDSQDNVYIAGSTASTDLPGTSAGFEPTAKAPIGGSGTYQRVTAFVAKFNPTLTQLLAATFLGGSYSESATGIAVDSSGNAIVVGRASSTDFPLMHAVQSTCSPAAPSNNFSCSQTSISDCPSGQSDAFITKLDPSLSHLIYSTYLGGSDDDFATSVTIDASGDAVVTGGTSSITMSHAGCPPNGPFCGNNAPDKVGLSTTSNAYYPTPVITCGQGLVYTPSHFAWIAKFSPTGALDYSSYFGPALVTANATSGGNTWANDLALDSTGNVYLAGQTNDATFTNIPGTTSVGCNSCNNGKYNGWLAKLNLNNSGAAQLLYSNMFGGTADDLPYSLVVDSTNNMYVGGTTYSTDYPTTQGVIQPQNTDTYFGNGFVTKFNPAGNNLVFSTYLGGQTGEVGGNIAYLALGPGGTVIASGGNNITMQNTICCAYLTQLSADATKSLYFDLYGGWASEAGPVVADGKGHAYVVGGSQGGIPTGSAAYASCPNLNNCATNGGNHDAFIVKFSFTAAVNDFTGNGRAGELLYDPSQGQSYTAVSNGNGTYQYVPNLFTPHFDTLRTGDYNGDGKADLILYNSQTAAAYIGFGNGDGTFNFQSLFWSPGYDVVATGDINGDAKTDVALYNGTTGTLYTGISNGSGTFTYQYHLVSQGFTFVRLADFTGDGKADLFLYNSNSGLAYFGIGDGAGNFTFGALSVSSGYSLDDIGDLNGDGKADVILYNPASGNAATGISNGTGGFTFTPLVFSPGFTSVRMADYTGDGKADVTVYNKNTAVAYFGTGKGDGTFNFQSLFWSPGYDYVIAEDVNGDGKTDVVLYSSPTGTEYTGISNGNGTFSYTYSYWGIGKLLASQ